MRLSSLTAVLVALAAASATAQTDTSSAKPRRGGDGALPLASAVVPGLGQFIQGVPVSGVAFLALAALGYSQAGDRVTSFDEGLPRGTDGQLRSLALQAGMVAAGLSAYDAFQRELPTLKKQGRYAFLTHTEPTHKLLTAPIDPAFLKRWTTWVHLGYTALVTTVAVTSWKKPGDRYLPLAARDGAFAVGLAAGAALPEEAFFRGWLFPYFRQHLGGSVGPNALQAGLFGVAHIPNDPGPFLAAIGGWAFYEGWVTDRNGGSVRESIFHHFWYDAALFVAALATDTGSQTLSISVPIRF